MAANIEQKIKFTNSHRVNFLMIPQSCDKTWGNPPQIAASGDIKTCFHPMPPLTIAAEILLLICPSQHTIYHATTTVPSLFWSCPCAPSGAAPAVAKPPHPAGHEVAATSAISR